jgi:hypothetical protein
VVLGEAPLKPSIATLDAAKLSREDFREFSIPNSEGICAYWESRGIRLVLKDSVVLYL